MLPMTIEGQTEKKKSLRLYIKNSTLYQTTVIQ